MTTRGRTVSVMTNNKVFIIENSSGTLGDISSRNRLIRLYNRNRKIGGWRKVAELRGSKNQQYIYNYAMHGIEPPKSNLRERKACFIPLHKSKLSVKPPLPEWLRRVKKNIALMAKATRESMPLLMGDRPPRGSG